MPVIFRQRPNLRPAPAPVICPDQAAQDSAFARFLAKQRALAGDAPLLLLNLIDMHGWQGRLAAQYFENFTRIFTTDAARASGDGDSGLRYFLGARRASEEEKASELRVHGAEVGELSILRLWEADFASTRAAGAGTSLDGEESAENANDAKGQGRPQLVLCAGPDCCYAHLDYHSFASAEVGEALADVFGLVGRAYPGAVPRINCVDSLDRTNAALAVFLGVRGASRQENALLDDLVAGGNAISRQYASSDAMKQDQVRFGVRTLGGRLSDLRAWFLRLLRNNSSDAAASDGFRVVQGEPSTSEERRARPVHVNAGLFTAGAVVLCLAVCVGVWELSDRTGTLRGAGFIWTEVGVVLAFFCIWLVLLFTFGENFAGAERL